MYRSARIQRSKPFSRNTRIPLIMLTIFAWISPITTGTLPAQVMVGFNNFTTIQAALNFVQANQLEDALVTVEPGFYCENLQMPTNVNVELVSTNPALPAATVIDGKMLGTVITCSSDNSEVNHTLRGFTVFNGSDSGIAILEGCELLIDRCDINGNTKNLNLSNSGGGGVFVDGGRAEFVQTTLRNNTASLGGGIFVEEGGSAEFGQGCQISNNSSILFGGGFNCQSGANLVVGQNTNIMANTANQGGAGFVEVGAQVDVMNCSVMDNTATIPIRPVGGIFFKRAPMDNQGLIDNVQCTNNLGSPMGFRLEFAPSPLTNPNDEKELLSHRVHSRARYRIPDMNGMAPDIPIITNCTFENGNTDPISGDASGILIDGVDVMILDCQFTGNESNNDGGAILCTGGANPTIIGCTFENNSSLGSFDEGAGAIVCDGTSPAIIDCNFIGNTAAIEAGAIRNKNGASPLIQNCMFMGNIADRVAGAIMNQNGSMPMIVDCTFEMNMTTNPASEGGAVVNDGASPMFENCDFMNNVSADATVLSDDNSQFPSTPQFINCDFSGNDGGVLDIQDSTLTMIDCQFDSNQSGVVLTCLGSTSTLNNCHFDSNLGRAISLNDSPSNTSSFNANNCSFSNHNGSDAPTVFAFDTDACFSNCLFTNNASTINGGALLMVNCDLITKYCDFDNNSAAEDGGAIGCFNGTTGTHIGCRFTGNSAGVFGGAIYYSESSVASYLSCAFSANTSDQDGGAIVTRDLPADTISNCSFINNSAANVGGVIFADTDTAVEINNSILWENGTHPVHAETGSTANVSFSNIQGGFAGTGNMDTDPLFVNPLGNDGFAGTLDDDLALQSSSPMIDAGNNNAVPADALDMDGDGDLAEPMPFDLKMMVRFADHPGVADVGVGEGPITDIGAVEFSTLLLGDVNQDGVVNLLDIEPFVALISSSIFQMEADLNQDGVVNLLDIEPFIAILSGG